MNNVNNKKIELTEDHVRSYLRDLKDKDLEKHYTFTEAITCSVTSTSDVIQLMEKNRPLEISINNNEVYYKITGEMEKDELFEVDTSTSFSHSNEWFFRKIIDVEVVYPNISSSPISSEMTAFYICLIIASTIGKEFEEEFKETIVSYDFNKWQQNSRDEISFVELSKAWIQMGSETIKMIAAAAKYALSRNSKKREIKSQIDIPEELASEFKQLVKTVDDIRYEYDNVILSEVNKAQMGKLDIKVRIKERDDKISAVIGQNNSLHQLWRLIHLNSNVIDPSDKRSYIRSARKKSKTVFKDLFGFEPDIENNDHLFNLKRIQDKLKKEAIRAAINRITATEINKYNACPAKYIAPNFV